ncbi:MAG: primosomal protein N' [Gammaproteobacteria bacterium]|nr:primosomal protein N' [Gammaproteobacteria bacterium]
MSTYLHIVIASGLRQVFTYLPRPDHNPLPAVGCRVLVPFGRSQRVGLVVAHSDACDLPAAKLKPVLETLDNAPLLPEPLWQLGNWAANYYQHPTGDALLHLLPVRLRQGHNNQLVSRFWQRLESTPVLARAPRQEQVWQQLQSLPEIFSERQLNSLKLAAKDLKPLLEKGLITLAQPPQLAPAANLQAQPLQLNDEQQSVYNSIRKQANQFACHLLQGITGSGKTEVYLQLIEHCLEQGQRALILVPEIGLTHQLLARLQQRFNNRLLALHSGLTDQQRLDAWQQSSLGQGDIILGTRSAVFTPIPNLGLMIIDEEHDQAFKQQEGFRYHGRDVAIKRAYDANIPIILGSATPSLESLANSQRQRYQLHRLNYRAGGASQQQYEIIDLRQQPVTAGISERLSKVMQTQLQAGHQVLLMLNRRGFAPSLQCQACGQTVTCPACDTSITLHKSPARLHCHHCDHRQTIAYSCPHCQARQMRPLGSGTERIEEQLQAQFPAYPVHRIDRDTTRNKGSLAGMLEQIHQGLPCILIGTQMLAKGHHFTHVTAAVIVDADSSLFCSDFRAPERLAQLIIQTSGRAGRASLPGTAYIQTYQAEHPVITSLTQQGYNAFAELELQHRQVSLLPPFGHMALFLVQARQEQAAYSLLTWLQQQLGQPELAASSQDLQHFGPMPATMAKRANQFRVQLQLQHPSRTHLQHLCRHLCGLLEQHPDSKKLRWSLDIDPQDVG